MLKFSTTFSISCIRNDEHDVSIPLMRKCLKKRDCVKEGTARFSLSGSREKTANPKPKRKEEKRSHPEKRESVLSKILKVNKRKKDGCREETGNKKDTSGYTLQLTY
ncbi:hypothetical protein KQX54_017926 [Cotesia glomerata]|uniref:Uncharacterized protein n=1 Tax=Cotesia glomerata TaxID=32391 RepID=A0AAV7ID30_COTGL|nr:hypothetical protein KQX54_017926 [Cotesia glomerata]